MEITKREILFGTIIAAIMIGLGVLLSGPIITSATDSALRTVSAVQVEDSTRFDYIRRTDVGDFLAEGDLFVVDPVSIPDISGQYGKIEKIKEEYREHTRTVTETDSEGHTHTRTETYWEWDRVDSWKWESDVLRFLGHTFTPHQIEYRFRTHYKETIEPKAGFFGVRTRYKYYTAPTVEHGTIIGIAKDKQFTSTTFERTTIKEIIENANSNIDVAPVLFWVLWMLLTGGIIVGFFYAENHWLY